ncbi:MAG: hypothetical protein JHC33_05655 [Ignisphaera sp.]|nr:hypothetical protein [Ignisphaera sp.]
MTNTLSVAHEHKEAFKVFYAASLLHIPNNKKIVSSNFRKFKKAIEQKMLQMAADKLNSLFGDEFMNQVMIDFEFNPYTGIANSGGTDFCFENPELDITINFNTNLRALYKKDLRLFCLTLADIFTHELIHCIQYIKQYQSIGVKEDLLKETIFKNKEHLFKLDPRYNTMGQYYEDLPYFSKHEELVCYAKDSARQLLTVYKDKNIVISKLSNVSELKDLSEASDCFYYYYDCFYARIPELRQYQLLWKSFTKHLYHNLHEDFEI